MKILVAEDDATSRIMLCGILKKWGYEPIEVSDGFEAIKVLQEKDAPHLAIMDWMMPKMEGVEVCRWVQDHLKSHNPPYIILLTSKSEKDFIVEGLNAGASDYLAKPYDVQELQARLRVGRRFIEMQQKLVDINASLSHEVAHDSLTGAQNRASILESLEGEIRRSERNGSSFCVSMLDLDHFKRINDTYGHLVGDQVLIRFAKSMRDDLRPYDQFGRYGGEEFLLITPDAQSCSSHSFFDRLRKVVSELEFRGNGQNFSVSVSIGVTEFKKGMGVKELIAEADEALYRAKKNGRDQVVIFEDCP